MYDFVFVPEPSGHHPRFKTYTNSFPCHIANPFWFHVRSRNWASGPCQMWLFPNSLPCLFYPITSNAIFIKIDPCGKEFAMNIQRAHNVGNAVVWGHHLRVPLRHQNPKLSTPSREKMPTEHQKHNNQHDDDATSAFVSKSHLMQQVRSPPTQPTTPTPPQRPP